MGKGQDRSPDPEAKQSSPPPVPLWEDPHAIATQHQPFTQPLDFGHRLHDTFSAQNSSWWLHKPRRLGGPHRFRAGAESKVAHKWARWLHNPCRLGVPHRFTAEDKIRSGPQVGKVATYPLPPRGSPRLQSGGLNQKWPTSGQRGHITPSA